MHCNPTAISPNRRHPLGSLLHRDLDNWEQDVK
jgi:hypothetical protein